MYDAIVLAGGSARRLGGVDKAALDIGGRSLLQRVLAAAEGAARVVVVGPPRALPERVLGTSERPSGGGPVAGLAAGLALVKAPLVAVLACDLPFVSADTVGSLAAALSTADAGAADGAQLVDETGQRQPLTAIYRTARLAAAIGRLPAVGGTPLRVLVEALTMLDVAAVRGEAWDCDTWHDVRRARDRVHRHPLEEP